jgi:glycolate oxidase iron-sulfur subunit
MSDLSATDRCVKCGLCLPHCPTFRLSGIEADSPRGRISLMQAMDSPDVSWSPGLFRYLDRCLECRACEAMCPSKVPFGQLMDTARTRMEAQRQRSLSGRWLRAAGLAMLASPARLKLLGLGLGLYRRLGLQRLISRLPGLPHGLRRLNRLLPARPTAAAAPLHNVPETRGTVELFRGCIASLIDAHTLAAARRLLQQLGYRVNVPARQGCCGALHQHNGAPRTAGRLAESNRTAFGDGNNPILVTASGCAVQLLDYGTLYGEAGVSQRVSDILHFLLAHERTALQFSPLPQTVAVHIPCSHRNVLGQAQDILAILDWIPGLRPLPLNPHGGCCGAAGSYLLSQPEVADQLRDDMLEPLARSDTRLLVTSNIGCSMHLQAGLREKGLDIEVVHPVVLLARQLQE